MLWSHERWATYVTWHNAILGKTSAFNIYHARQQWNPVGRYSLGLQVEDWQWNAYNRSQKSSLGGLYNRFCAVKRLSLKNCSYVRTKRRKKQLSSCETAWQRLQCRLTDWDVSCVVFTLCCNTLALRSDGDDDLSEVHQCRKWSPFCCERGITGWTGDTTDPLN